MTIKVTNRITKTECKVGEEIDEVVSTRAQVHLEEMNDNVYWLQVIEGKEVVTVWFRAEGNKLIVTRGEG